jgi:predicted transposase/invertase (TIGR01784 family)
MKTEIFSLSYDAMFRAIFTDNKYLLVKLVKAILKYYKINILINEDNIIVKKNELNIDKYNSKRFVCDYIIRIDEEHDINIELNRNSYYGLHERNITYSFKIYYEHFKIGNTYQEFNKYVLLQVNFNKYRNPNDKSINRFYLIDIDDVDNMLTNNYSIMNIDIEKCYDLVYNKTNLDEVSELEVWGAIINATYLEDIASILESEKISMSNEEKERFLEDIEEKSHDKSIYEAVTMEKTMDDRIKIIENGARRKGLEEGRAEGLQEGRQEGIELGKSEGIKLGKSEGIKLGRAEGRTEAIDDMIKSFIKAGVSLEVVSRATGKSIDYIKTIIK